MSPRILTTLVGSYPLPDWLVANPSEQALVDATRVVLHTQEHAGIDLVCDGELYRFDPDHPETNGMIEYFVRPMAGVRTAITFEELVEYRSAPGMGFRRRPPGIVVDELGSGTLDLPDACARAKRLATRPLKFTITGPHMLAKTLINRHYADRAELAWALARVLAEQVEHCEADVVQLDEANLPGSPDEWPWAAEAINVVLRAVKTKPAVHLCFGNYGGQSVQKGAWAKLIELSQRAPCRSRGDGERASSCRGACRIPRAQARDRHGARRGRYQTYRDRDGRRDCARDRARGERPRARPGALRAPRLRVLDAQALGRRCKDPRPGRGPRSL
jgi:5-methyltetrahydropteroyltriglutamate--homocysteine methyltransferase